MGKDNFKEEQPQIWIAVPKSHTKLIVCLTVAVILFLLGVFLVGGYLFLLAAGILTAVIAVVTHYLLQKKFVIDNIIFYYERGELYMISLNKSDDRLAAYLNGNLEEVPPPTENPVDRLLEMANLSVIWHLTKIFWLEEKTLFSNNPKYMIGTGYNLPPYPYSGNFTFKLSTKYFENFDSLLEVLKSKRL